MLSFMNRKTNAKQNKSLSQKMAFTFFYFVVFPCLLISFLSAIFFQRGIHSWFKERIQVAMISAKDLSQSYIRNSLSQIEKSSDVISHELIELIEKNNENGEEGLSQHTNISQFLDLNELIGGVSSVLFQEDFSQKGIYHKISPRSFSKKWSDTLPRSIPYKNIEEARKNTSSVFLNPEESHLSILRHIHHNTFLMVGKFLDPFIVQNVFDVKSSINSYTDDLEQEKRWFWSSVFLFLLTSFVLVGLSFWGSFSFKKQIIQPVDALLRGVKMLQMGKKYFVNTEKIKTSKELLLLMDSFNKMALDIKKKKEGLEKINRDLYEKNIFMETVFQSVSSGVIILSEKGSVLLCNKQAENLLSQEKLIGKKLSNIHKDFEKMLEHVIQNPKKIHTREIFLKRNMRTYRVHMRHAMTTKNVIATLDDVGSLIASQKKGAFLSIARRVAHEIRNPLTPIVLSAQRLSNRYTNEVKDKDTFQDCLDSIIRQSEIIGDIVKEFSYFVRMPPIQLSKTNLGSLIKKIINFEKEAYPNIRFRSDLSQSTILCDPSHIERAIMNLLKNSIESMEDNTGPRKIDVSIQETEQHIQIIVKDNGGGMDVEHVLATHEPYCTTKSQGMGLGLSIVEKVADDHRGRFLIYNNKEKNGVTAMLELSKNHSN